MMQYLSRVDRRQAGAADAKRLNGNSDARAVSDQGFGGGSATNEPSGDEYF